MSEELISFEDLRGWLQCRRASKVLEWMHKNGIEPMFDEQGKPITTRSKINGAESKPEVRL